MVGTCKIKTITVWWSKILPSWFLNSGTWEKKDSVKERTMSGLWTNKQSGRISHFPEHCKTLSCDDVSMIQVPKRMLFIVVSTVKEFPANVQTIGKKGRNTQQDRVLFRSILTTWDLDEAYIFEELQVMNKTATNKANISESLEKSR